MTEQYLSREQVRTVDRRAIEEFGISGVVLMENAGRGCAEVLSTLNPERQPVTILCGPGNNGGDGFVIARHLDNHRVPVRVYLFGDPHKLTPDAAANLRPLQMSDLVTVVTNPAEFAKVLNDIVGGWIVDALFGTGLTRPITGALAELIEAVNAVRRPVLAVDIPSGLDADTGEPIGPTVRATHTATFVAKKLGFRNPNAAEWTGTLTVVDIGAPRALIESVVRSVTW